MKAEAYTISVHTENNMGLINRISSIFLKRRINIDNLRISTYEVSNVAKFIFEVQITENQIKNLRSQIEKQIGVIKTSYQTRLVTDKLKTDANSVELHK